MSTVASDRSTAVARGRFDTEDMLARLVPWVACESPTHEAASVNRMMDLVATDVASAGLEATRIPGRDGLGDMLLLRAGPTNGEPVALVLSHLDTVHPLGTIAGDLPLRREGDRLYGPGVYDMKGGAFLALEAFRHVARAGTARRPMQFLFTPDEEIGSPISRAVIEDLARHAAHVLVTEPARDGGKIVTARKGVGRFDVEIEGIPAHSGTHHERGRSAIREAAHQILAIEALTDRARGVTTTVGLVSGGSAANVVPRTARFSVDLRVRTIEDGETFAARIRSLRPVNPDVRLTVTGDINRPPMERSAGNGALFEKARALAVGIGIALEEVPMTGGGSDGNFTAALGIATLDGLGIDGEGAHTLAEHALISSLSPRAELIARLLETV